MAQPSFDSILNAVMLAESGGRRYDEKGRLLTSTKGAKGEMQVLDTTNVKPGFGVEPARSDSPEERARVGRDYLKAMLDRYGSLERALVAYNWGPGNADQWIAKGADLAKLPSETKSYLASVKSRLSQPTTTAKTTPEAAPMPAPAVGAPGSRTVVSAAELPAEEPQARLAQVASRTAELGPSYQAALALSYLADENEKEGREERGPSISQQWLSQPSARSSLADFSLKYRSPFDVIEPQQPVGMADGGMIAVGYEDGGEVSAEELERASRPAFGVVPSSGRGRKQGRISETLQSGEAQREFLKGSTLLPQNLVGAPVDLATMAMRPFGYNVEKPVMGSEWLKEKSRQAGVAFPEPTDPTLRGFYTAGDIASNLVNPAAATRTVASGTKKAGQAAKMLAEMAGETMTAPSGTLASQRGAVRLPGGHFAYQRQLNPATGMPEYVDPVTPLIREQLANTKDEPLNQWMEQKIGKYLRRDVGTENDPFVIAADQGKKLHHTWAVDDPNKPYTPPEHLINLRKTEGMSPFGTARTGRGQRLEARSDQSIEPMAIADLPGRNVPPGLKQFVETDPEMRVYGIGTLGVKAPVFERMELRKLRDEMLDMRAQPKEYSKFGLSVNVPEEYRFTDKALEGLTPAQASERVAKFQDWKTEADARLAVKAIRRDPDIPKTTLEDGSMWAEFPDLNDDRKFMELALGVGCSGKWCTRQENFAKDYGTGDNRLAVLLGPTGRPDAQVTITRVQPRVNDFLEFGADNGEAFANEILARGVQPWSQAFEAAVRNSPEFQAWAANQPPNVFISEIKGWGNEVLLDKFDYVKPVQEYVKKLDAKYDLNHVDNLAGINMLNLLPYAPYPSVQKEAIRLNGGSKYVEKDQLDGLLEQAFKNVAVQP